MFDYIRMCLGFNLSISPMKTSQDYLDATCYGRSDPKQSGEYKLASNCKGAVRTQELLFVFFAHGVQQV